jgi:hypothetical protein
MPNNRQGYDQKLEIFRVTRVIMFDSGAIDPSILRCKRGGEEKLVIKLASNHDKGRSWRSPVCVNDNNNNTRT